MTSIEKDSNLVLIGAKVKPPVKDVIDAMARSEDRSVSRTVARLLESHPEVAALLNDIPTPPRRHAA